MIQLCLFYLYSITHTCKRMYRDQSHDFMFNNTNVMRGNATKSWKLAAILDFGGHFDFVLSDSLTHADQIVF